MRLLLANEDLPVTGVDETEVIAEVKFCEPPEILDRLVGSVSAAVEVDVESGAGRRHPSEHARPAFEDPLGVRSVGEDATEEPIEILQADPLTSVACGVL